MRERKASVMEKNDRPEHEEVAEPGPRAEIQINVGPVPKGWGTVKVNVPADQAHHLVTTVGILGSVAAGVVGVTLTLQEVSGAIILAYAELVLAFIAAVLIALCSRTDPSIKGGREKPDTLSADRPARGTAAAPVGARDQGAPLGPAT